MPGVDFVINPLLETSGLRWDADCARAVVVARASKTKETKKKLIGFTALILFLSAECKAAKHCRTPKTWPSLQAHFALAFWSAAVLLPLLISSLTIFLFFEQLLLQMSPRSLLNCSTLG